MKALCIRPLSTAYSSNRNDDFVILLHERKINSIKNLDQIIFWGVIAQGPLLKIWSHVEILPGRGTEVDVVFMRNIDELAFMYKIEGTD